MKIKRFVYILLITSMLGCNFLTDQFITPATATPRPTETSTPLAPAYIPPNCQSAAIATIPAATALAQPTPALQANPEIPTKLQKQVFQAVVNTVNTKYVYTDFNGKDWNAIVAKHKAEIDAGLNAEAFYTSIESMITELGDEHSHFESPVEVAESKAELSGVNDYVGVGIYGLPEDDKGQTSVISVFPDSPAEHGGIKSHDSILAIDGLPVYKDKKSYMYLTRGPECSAVVLTIKSPDQDQRQIMLVRDHIDSPLVIDARLVPTTDGSRVAYIFLPTFFDQTIPKQVRDALVSFGHLDGLILDNRLNGGGSSTVVEPILSYFISGTLGEFKSRAGAHVLNIKADRIENSQEVPLVVLVGEDTVSFGEIFSGIMQDSGRAKIVGQTTLGNVETLYGYDFNDGSTLWIAQEVFDPTNTHANWESTGIIPDMQAYADWDTFTFESDPGVAAALKALGH